MLIIMKIMQTTDEEDIVIVRMALDKMYQVRVNVGIDGASNETWELRSSQVVAADDSGVVQY